MTNTNEEAAHELVDWLLARDQQISAQFAARTYDVVNHCDVEVALGQWQEHEGHCEFGNGISATCTCGCDLCGAAAGVPCEAPCANVTR